MKARFQAYLNRIFRQPVVEKFQTPRRRRGLVVALLLVELAAAACFVLIPYDIIWPLFPAFIAALQQRIAIGDFERISRHHCTVSVSRSS